VKRVTIISRGCSLAVALSWSLIWCSLLYHNHGCLGFRCGLLATASDPYLDGFRKPYQKCSWHLGNGTRTWGETYGLEFYRLYISMEVRHTNPRITPDEARETGRLRCQSNIPRNRNLNVSAACGRAGT